jgi:putative ABC transport system permease protein
MIYFSNWVDNKYKNNKYISVKLSCPYTGEVVSNLDRFFKKFFQGREANYDYLPDMMEKYYIEDNKLSIMFNLFTIVAIILSCVGILGVSIYDLTKRTKEIAIRKVNGASSMQILYIINLDILKYIVVSIIIGIPIAYYIMKNWLMHYPVRISIPWYVFAFAGLSVMFISLLTISFFTIKASRQNPVKTLKSE